MLRFKTPFDVKHILHGAELAHEAEHNRCERWLRRTTGWTRLHAVCDARDTREALRIIRCGDDPQATDAHGRTPVDVAFDDVDTNGSLPLDATLTRLLLDATTLWSPRTHYCFPDRARARAWYLLLIGTRLYFCGGLWVGHVVPMLISRSSA